MTGAMAMNIAPPRLVTSGIVDQYSALQLAYHNANLLCPADPSLRRRPMASYVAMQQFGFPGLNFNSQRRIYYEVLFYRGSNVTDHTLLAQRCFLDEDGTSIEVCEEWVRLHPSTRAVDPRQPFQTVVLKLVQSAEDEEAEGEGGEGEEPQGKQAKQRRAKIEERRARLARDWYVVPPSRFSTPVTVGPIVPALCLTWTDFSLPHVV